MAKDKGSVGEEQTGRGLSRRRLFAAAGAAVVATGVAAALDKLGVFGGHSSSPAVKNPTDVIVSMYDPKLPLSQAQLTATTQAVGGNPKVLSPTSSDVRGALQEEIAGLVKQEEPVGVLTIAGTGNGGRMSAPAPMTTGELAAWRAGTLTYSDGTPVTVGTVPGSSTNDYELANVGSVIVALGKSAAEVIVIASGNMASQQLSAQWQQVSSAVEVPILISTTGLGAPYQPFTPDGKPQQLVSDLNSYLEQVRANAQAKSHTTASARFDVAHTNDAASASLVRRILTRSARQPGD